MMKIANKKGGMQNGQEVINFFVSVDNRLDC
jgi:hypothetical protein